MCSGPPVANTSSLPQCNKATLFGGLMPDNKLEVLHRDEHFMLTNVEWDPSSRYIMTSVTQPMPTEGSGFKYQMEAGYAIYTFQGRQLWKQQKEKLYEVCWRPHPPSLLEPKKQNSIKKDIRQFSRKYDAKDEQAKSAARAKFTSERKELTDKFMDLLERLEASYDERADENGWTDAKTDFLGVQEWEKVESIIEEDLDFTEELIQ